MTNNTKNFNKLVNKAFAFAYTNDIEAENYTPTDIYVWGNDIHVDHVNEYGGRYGVLTLNNAANLVYSYREIKQLIKC